MSNDLKTVFRAVRVTDGVYWVGAIDSSVRDFHGYLTGRGTTYNAYLILAEKVTLVDTVKGPFADELLARVASVVDPEKVDYIISNHSEPDHSGSLPAVIDAIRPEKVFASKMGFEALDEHFGLDGKVTAVDDGESVDLGDMKVTFAETRMCHWPDSMVSYLHEEALLFSQDAFGMHLASYERFADELDQAVLDYEAAKYYANILLPLSVSVEKSLQKLASLNLELRIIAPDHGPIYRRRPERIVEAYARWARQERTKKAVVVYDTMWNSTERMARAIGEGLAAGGASPRLQSMRGSHRSDVATELLDAGALVVGAPTINNEMFPTVADCLTYIKGLRPRGLVGAVFGSYGWGGGAAKALRSVLEQMHVELVAEPLQVKYVPDAGALERCRDLGMQVAEALTAKVAAAR
jgi:flavorubredoxin